MPGWRKGARSLCQTRLRPTKVDELTNRPALGPKRLTSLNAGITRGEPQRIRELDLNGLWHGAADGPGHCYAAPFCRFYRAEFAVVPFKTFVPARCDEGACKGFALLRTVTHRVIKFDSWFLVRFVLPRVPLSAFWCYDFGMNATDSDRLAALRKIAISGWSRWFRKHHYAEELEPIRELGASESQQALTYLKRLAQPTVSVDTRSETDGLNNTDWTFYSAEYECVSFPNAKGDLRKSLYYELRRNSPYGVLSTEEIEAARELILGNEPHRSLARSIPELEHSIEKPPSR